MPKKFSDAVYSVLNGRPVLYSSEKCFTIGTNVGSWVSIAEEVSGHATVLTEGQFFRRFGTKLPKLPSAFQHIDHRLWIIDGGKLVFGGFHRRQSTSPSQLEPAELINFPIQPVEQIFEKGSQTRFYLGEHNYSQAPGCSWSTEYEIERLDTPGTRWEIFSKYNDDPTEDENGDPIDPVFDSMGVHTTDEAKEYFDSVLFDISEERWDAMGQAKTDVPDYDEDYDDHDTQSLG